MSHDELQITIENAFAPLRIVSEIWDYQEKIRFAVFDGDEMLFHAGDEKRKDVPIPIRDGDRIQAEIENGRELIGSKGYSLQHWSKLGD